MRDPYYQLLLISFCVFLLPHYGVVSLRSVVASSGGVRKNGSRRLLLALHSTTTTITTTTSTEQETTVVARPVIHWTVPGFKVGWQDEKTGNWFDEDGPRNGPPLNYWRQRIDEREYHRDMEVVNTILSSSSSADDDIDQLIDQCEASLSVRRPSLNRKILGEWGPILRCGKRVASSAASGSDADDGSDSIHIPFRMSVYRSEGRQLAPKNAYGVFDAKLKEGELVTVDVVCGSGMMNQQQQTYSFAADAKNEPIICDIVQEKPLFLGGITYLSDYIFIQRGPEGDVDVWLRLDDAYLGKNKPDDIDESLK
mmetsp:Transcript_17717/g.26234  ORF Transcript_17717/g.26234 Transcript_17717/m.26234 type:complete len:311 (+) Transcript_17717:180-1112(+)|eukprot:CAMPEP_0194202560 /NCGR_PEP_ID=MMETSP0156-20130528/2549_1 /TAXON_ID=33649 /ORGANISM="Thalassionema nitzschioides, Strain L26-B" /LENGTH=310 /DNA_ID=CAMNT_0038928081 /DNA_START=97 /DNA_END=1029 /DNA_ORIENTATION=-